MTNFGHNLERLFSTFDTSRYSIPLPKSQVREDEIMQNCLIASAAAIAALAFTTPSYATIFDVPLGVIVVPPTQTFASGLTYVQNGVNGANFSFTISQAMTLTASSFTNSSLNGTGVFNFSSLGLYNGIGIADTLLQSGTFAIDGDTRRASLSQYLLSQGTYTIAYRGTVSGAPAGVGSNITFAAASAVPEPTAWSMLIIGVGAMGAALRRRHSTIKTSVSFA